MLVYSTHRDAVISRLNCNKVIAIDKKNQTKKMSPGPRIRTPASRLYIQRDPSDLSPYVTPDFSTNVPVRKSKMLSRLVVYDYITFANNISQYYDMIPYIIITVLLRK